MSRLPCCGNSDWPMPDSRLDAADIWREVDAQIVRRHGSFLRNVRLGAPGVCHVCAAPVGAGYKLCLACNKTLSAVNRSRSPNQLADRIAFMTYAVENRQAYSVLRGYKKPEPDDGRSPQSADRYIQSITLWTLWLLERHAQCAHDLSGIGGRAWMWATIPSVRSARRGEHPLHRIVKQIWGSRYREVPIRLPERLHTRPRDYDSNLFTAEPVPPRTHVIVVDDSWTTGANLQSAATALKKAGAAQVSGMVLGRLLRDSWGPTKEFIDSDRFRTPFDPTICPWAAQASQADHST